MNNSAPSFDSRYGPPNGAKQVPAKRITCWQEGNEQRGCVELAVNNKYHRSFETLLTDLTAKMPDLSHGVRSIYTPSGHTRVNNIEQFEHGREYICSQKTRSRPVPLATGNRKMLKKWYTGKPPSGRRAYSFSLRNDVSSMNGRPPKTTYYQTRSYPGSDTDQSPQPQTQLYHRVECKRIMLRKDGVPSSKHVLLLNKKSKQEFEEIRDDVAEMFQMSSRKCKLFTLEGEPIESLSAIYNGPQEYIVSDSKGNNKISGWVAAPVNGHVKKRPRARDAVMEEAVNQRQKKPRSKGFWTVCVTTRPDADSGTTANVCITVQGSRGCSEPIPLNTTVGDGIMSPFEAGNKDEFKISVGHIGEVKKIRLSHDNAGDSPSWYVGEVLMIDIHSNEQLVFRFDRWLSRDHDHGEICREMPAVRQGKATPTVRNYYVTVHTGDCYNAGTEGNVFIELKGENGDTGPRQLCKTEPPKDKLFQKGTADTFILEAVDLGRLQNAMIAHDAVGAGFGWFLEKVVVTEGDDPDDASYTFPCGRWLDEGEGFGKIAIDLTPVGQARSDKHDEVMWNAEKWKFATGNQLLFFSKTTEKVLRFNSDLKVDALGEEEGNHSVFTVVSANGRTLNLQSRDDPSVFLAFEKGKVSRGSRAGPNTTLRIEMNPDRSVGLAFTKKGSQADQALAFNDRGLPLAADELPPPESNLFVPYCKGMLRNDGVLMFCTSATQALTVDDGSLHGTGKRNRLAHFKVQKTDEGNVRMFESVVFKGQYLRIKDDRCDCLGTGDVSCEFRVDVYKDRGFVTLQSVSKHGYCIGMSADGRVVPKLDKGEADTRFFPEVVTFGTPRAPIDVGTPLPCDIPTPTPSAGRSRSSPRIPTPTAANSRPPSNRKRTPPPAVPEEEYQADDWRLMIQSGETASSGANVAVYVYGWTTNSGRIELGPTGSLFQANNRDEFKINLKDLGDLIKIRVELEPADFNDDLPTWQLQEISMEHPNSGQVINFDTGGVNFSLEAEGGSLAHELPVNGALPQVRYAVALETSDLPDAGTAANVFVALFGDHGDTGRRLLRQAGKERQFQAGAVDNFEFDAVHLGALKRCLVAHDAKFAGDGWHCARVTVTDPHEAKDYVFPCERWLDAGEEDNKIERVLRPSENDDPQLEAIRKDAQELIDDVTERVAKRIEDHHARES